MKENKIIFTGPVGVGKTTAISALSDEPPVQTDADASDMTLVRKGIQRLLWIMVLSILMRKLKFICMERQGRNGSILCGKFLAKVVWVGALIR